MDAPACNSIDLQTILTIFDSVDCRLIIVYIMSMLSGIIGTSCSFSFSAVNYCWSMSHNHLINSVLSVLC